MSSSGDDNSPQTPPITPEIRALIKRERRLLGMSQRVLAQAAGVHRSVISKVEAGDVLHSVHLPSILGALRSPPLLPSQEQPGFLPTVGDKATQTIIQRRNAQKTESHGEFVLVPMFDAQSLKRRAEVTTAPPTLVQVPAMLLPALGQAGRSNLLMIRAAPGHHVIATRTAQARDGALTALLWRDDIVVARLGFTANGYRLARKHGTDEIDFQTFEQQVQLIGEVLAIFQLEI